MSLIACKCDLTATRSSSGRPSRSGMTIQRSPSSSVVAGTRPNPRSASHFAASSRSLVRCVSSCITVRMKSTISLPLSPTSSRTRRANPLGRPPGLPLWPGENPAPVTPPRVDLALFSTLMPTQLHETSGIGQPAKLASCAWDLFQVTSPLGSSRGRVARAPRQVPASPAPLRPQFFDSTTTRR